MIGFTIFKVKILKTVEEEPLSPRPRKRKLTDGYVEAIPEAQPSYQVKTDPLSPLKLKLCLSKPVLSNGNTFKITPTKLPPKSNGIINGKSHSSSPSTKKSVSVASDESSSETEEEEEIESEDDPEWNGRETPPPGNKRKAYRAVGSPKKRKRTQKQNGTPETDAETQQPAQPIFFNSDIVCPHLKIRHGAKMVRITEGEWSKIVTPFFDEFYKFSADCYECEDCEEEKHQEAMSHRQNKEIVAQINAEIQTLIRNLGCRKFSQEELGSKYTHVICGKFLEQFRSAAKSRSSSVVVPPLCQRCLICEHRRPYVVLDPSGAAANMVSWIQYLNNITLQIF